MEGKSSQIILSKKKQIDLRTLKSNFATKFPNSETTKILLSMPNESEGEELIGAVGVWLNILDMERTNNLKGGG